MAVNFKDIGKAVKNIFSKGYDYDYNLKTQNKSKDGITMSSGFAMEKGSVLSGTTGLDYVDPTFGEVNVKLKVNGQDEDENTSLSCKLDKVTPGLKLTASCNVIPEVKVTADYVPEGKGVAVQAELTSDMKFSNSSLSANGSFTSNNFSIGLSGGVDLIKQEATSYDAALQFKTSPHTISLVTKKQFSTFLLGYHTSAVDDLGLGVQVQVKQSEGAYVPVATVGVDYSVNPTTTLKSKAAMTTSDCTLSYSITQKLSNPPLEVSFAQELKPCTGDFAASNWGFGLTLGDY